MSRLKNGHPALSRIHLWSRLFIPCLTLSLLITIVTPLQTSAQNVSGQSFFDHLGPNDPLFFASDGYGNGSPFINAWKSDHVTFPDDHMELTLDNQPNFGFQYTSGEYRTHGFYGYG